MVFPVQHIVRDIEASRHGREEPVSTLKKLQRRIGCLAVNSELRLTKAKLLLKNTNLRIGQIACEVGFDSVSYFTETFSRSEKITPQKYRKLHKKD